MKKVEKSIKDIILICVLSIIPKLILVFYAYPFNIVGDEIWTLVSAAKIGGFDWSGILDGGRYYGMGFFSLLFPILKLVDNPVILYRIILCICVFINSLISLIAYVMLKRFSGIRKKSFLILMSVVASYIVILPINYIYNEHIYVLICWCIMLLLLLLDDNRENKKKVLFYTNLLLATLIYAMLIHNRAITLWLAVIGVIVLYFIAYRKWLVNWKVFLVLGVLGYYLVNIIIKSQVGWLWATTSDKLGNTTVYNGGLLNLLKPEYWQAWLSIVLGQLFAGDIFTGGLLLLLFVIAIIFIFRVILKLKDSKRDSKMFIVFLFTIICVMITIGGQSVNWLQGVKDAIEARSSDADAYRGLTYLRYYMAYVGPMLLLGTVFLKERWQEYKKYTLYVIWGKILLYLVWCAFIFPYIIFAGPSASSFRPFSFQHIFDTTSGMRTYFPAVGVAIILFVWLMLSLVYKKSYKALLIVFALFFLYKYMYTGITVLNTENSNYQSINGIANFVNEHKESKEKLKEIYVQGDRVLREELQFLFKNTIIRTDIENADEFILFSEYPEGTIEDMFLDVYYAQIDENEYVFVKGKSNLKIIEDLGIHLTMLQKN